ncbi:hypothetical protein JKP88DRAFT_351027 [Tribonema minus]|uniref:BZIP domain-containing protein n=1 Tax=Tribonema minus TaxID=303371 RepID=A0A835YJN1_9STRA|nr:hypothetical protein JKP88DRAFT_351027 [Tribonema minus]
MSTASASSDGGGGQAAYVLRPLKKRPLSDNAPPGSSARSTASTCSYSSHTSGTGSGDDGNSTDDDARHQQHEQGACSKRTKLSHDDKLAASRERNRVHAQKTRQRKKARLLDLQARARQLKAEQDHLQEAVDERATASLLLRLGTGPEGTDGETGASVRRGSCSSAAATDDAAGCAGTDVDSDEDDDNDEVELLDKLPAHLSCDLSRLTPDEREQIRRERNRLHAKRTRTRKKLVFQDLERQIRVSEKAIRRLRAILQQRAASPSQQQQQQHQQQQQPLPPHTAEADSKPARMAPSPTPQQAYAGSRSPCRKQMAIARPASAASSGASPSAACLAPPLVPLAVLPVAPSAATKLPMVTAQAPAGAEYGSVPAHMYAHYPIYPPHAAAYVAAAGALLPGIYGGGGGAAAAAAALPAHVLQAHAFDMQGRYAAAAAAAAAYPQQQGTPQAGAAAAAAAHPYAAAYYQYHQ